MIRTIGTSTLLVWLLLGAGSVVAAPWGEEEAIRSDILAFTDRSMDGLHPGSAGLDSAATRIAAAFEEAGLRPAFGDSTYFQTITAYTNVRAQGTNGLRDNHRPYVVREDWWPIGFSAEGRIDQAPLVFAGFGCNLPSEGLTDYAAIDVEGCVVLVLDQAPVEGSWRKKALRRQKAVWARERGAVGILFVSAEDPPGRRDDDPSAGIDLNAAFVDCRILAGYVAQATADSLLEESGFDIVRPAHGQEQVVRHGPVGDRRIDWIISLRRQHVTLRNVAGTVPGNQPGWVLIQAPYQGRGGRPDPEIPTWLPGANDVASGLSVLLELTRRIGVGRAGAGRSLVFAATVLTDEEQTGAHAVATELALTAEPIAAVVAMERIGRLSSGVHAAAGPDRQQWENLFAGRTPTIAIDQPSETAGDAEPLGSNGVPFVYLRGDPDPLAATEDDTPDRIDVGGLRRVAVLLDAVLRELADPTRFP